MKNVKINQVTIEEIDLLQKISQQTFFEAFSDKNTDANMQRYLTENLSKERLSAELSNPDSTFYVARLENKIIGYLKLNTGTAQTELQEEDSLEIERIYVLKDFHGQKVGQVLYEKAVQIAADMQASYIWLGVWEENKGAMNFYKKNGFIEFGKHIFKLGNDEQTDIMMKLKML